MAPLILTEMGNDWADQQKLSLNEFHQHIWICFTTFSDQVVFFNRLQHEETKFHRLLVFHFIIVLCCFNNGLVDGVFKDFIP